MSQGTYFLAWWRTWFFACLFCFSCSFWSCSVWRWVWLWSAHWCLSARPRRKEPTVAPKERVSRVVTKKRTNSSGVMMEKSNTVNWVCLRLEGGKAAFTESSWFTTFQPFKKDWVYAELLDPVLGPVPVLDYLWPLGHMIVATLTLFVYYIGTLSLLVHISK